MKTAERKQNLKMALIAAAERAVAARGLVGLKARSLAAEAGCAVGAIYNVVADLDDLALAVNSRTLAALEEELTAAAGVDPAKPAVGAERAVGRLIRMANAYLDFAAANTMRWRALFEHRLPEGKSIPGWYLGEQIRLLYRAAAAGSSAKHAAGPTRYAREIAVLSRAWHHHAGS